MIGLGKLGLAKLFVGNNYGGAITGFAVGAALSYLWDHYKTKPPPKPLRTKVEPRKLPEEKPVLEQKPLDLETPKPIGGLNDNDVFNFLGTEKGSDEYNIKGF